MLINTFRTNQGGLTRLTSGGELTVDGVWNL